MALKTTELDGMTEQELAQKAAALKQQLFQLRVQAKLGRLEQGHQLRAVRRDVARCLTAQHAKARHPASGGRPS